MFLYICSLQGRTYTFEYPEGGLGSGHTLGPMAAGSMGSIGSSNSGGNFGYHAHEGSMSSSQSVSSSNSKQSEDPEDELAESAATPSGDRCVRRFALIVAHVC